MYSRTENMPTMNHLLEYVRTKWTFCSHDFIPKTISDIHDLARNVFKSVKCRYLTKLP